MCSPILQFDDLTSGDRFTSGAVLWTKLDPNTARRHSPESLGLRANGHGYHGDAICSFERTDEVAFVEPHASIGDLLKAIA